MPEISVIVPVYKAKDTLRQCLDSLAAQTFGDFEVIIIDDGSPDSSGAICDEYAARDGRFQAIHTVNGGQTRARLAGFAASRGEYIAFLDSDDWYAPNAFELLIGAARESGADMVVAGVLEIRPDGEQTYPQRALPGFYDKERLEREIYPRMLYAGEYYCFGVLPALNSKLYRRALIGKWLPRVDARIRMGEDGACTYPCLLEANAVAVIGEDVYRYRFNPQSVSRSTDESFFMRIGVLLKYLESTFRELGAPMDAQLSYYGTLLTLLGVGNEARCPARARPAAKAAHLREAIASHGLARYYGAVRLKTLPKREAAYALALRLRLELPLFMWLGRKRR